MLCFLPMYHIYGLTVGLNLALIRGCYAGADAALRLRGLAGNRRQEDVTMRCVSRPRCWPIAMPPSRASFRASIS